MRKTLFIVAAVIAIAAILLTVPAIRCVSVSNRKMPSEHVFSTAALNGFSISYTHSVNKGRVHDFYRCEGGMLVLEKTVFVSYGAGIPEASETNGAIFTVTDDGYVIANLNRRLEKLVMAVGVIAEHSITVLNGADGQEKEIFLKTIFAPQTSLILEIKKVPVLVYLFAKHI